MLSAIMKQCLTNCHPLTQLDKSINSTKRQSFIYSRPHSIRSSTNFSRRSLMQLSERWTFCDPYVSRILIGSFAFFVFVGTSYDLFWWVHFQHILRNLVWEDGVTHFLSDFTSMIWACILDNLRIHCCFIFFLMLSAQLSFHLQLFLYSCNF